MRGLFKGVIEEECISLAYITDMFPIKKYGKESVLNNFKEFIMVSPKWMDVHVYNPRSVVEALLSGECGSYWTNTETYEFLKGYISINFQGLKENIIAMLGGEKRWVERGRECD